MATTAVGLITSLESTHATLVLDRPKGKVLHLSLAAGSFSRMCVGDHVDIIYYMFFGLIIFADILGVSE